MSDDMISRRSILDKINEWSSKLNCENSKQFTLAEFEHMVVNETTAYDADKVVEQLESVKTNFIGMGTIQSAYFDRGIDKAIEIVKSGGGADD